MQAIYESGRRVGAGRIAIKGSSEAGAAHPALPAVVLLVSFAVFMAAIAPLNFSAMWNKFFPAAVQKSTSPDAVVWIDYSAGVYYCADSIMFGKSKGEYLHQAEALDRGYQPALGTFCQGTNWHIPPHPAKANSVTSPAPEQTVPAAQPPAGTSEPSPFLKKPAKPGSSPDSELY